MSPKASAVFIGALTSIRVKVRPLQVRLGWRMCLGPPATVLALCCPPPLGPGMDLQVCVEDGTVPGRTRGLEVGAAGRCGLLTRIWKGASVPCSGRASPQEAREEARLSLLVPGARSKGLFLP